MWTLTLTLLAGCNGGKDDDKVPHIPLPVDHRIPDSTMYVPSGRYPPPRECDAGDASWVSRTMPLVWGRKPHGAAEVTYWSQMAAEKGREAVVRAMTEDLQYYGWWLDWFADALYVSRAGDKEYGSCFEAPQLPSLDGSLARHIGSTSPVGGEFTAEFRMADVILDALVEDDVSVIYQAHLFARMNRPTQGANVSLEQLEYNRRVNFGELFYRTYLGRDLNCMVCHNSEFSTTDSSEPHLDRTWQLPGNFESALLGAPTGQPYDVAYAMFRYQNVYDSSGLEPWGMNPSCGEFVAPAQLPRSDFLDQDEAYFIQEYGPDGSVYDLERDLAAGVDKLAGTGLSVGRNGEVDGQAAFAYLLAANLSTQVWATATGHDLVVAHWFPRNEGQMIRLKAYADTLAQSGFSLRDLLVAVTTDPYFNPGLPSTCETMPYGLDPIFDPWVIEDETREKRLNGPGDLVHRLPSRMLLRTAHMNLGWTPRDDWFATNFFGQSTNPIEEAFQSGVGVFMRESDPGHRGTDFQGLLTFESELGVCNEPSPGLDFIGQVLAEGAASGTVGDVAAAVKDRLVAEGIDAEEQPLVEALLGASFADPVPADAAFEAKLRLYCGAILISPQFQLVTDARLGPVPSLGTDLGAECASVARLMQAAGHDVACTGSVLE